jgi:hypothetical protein
MFNFEGAVSVALVVGSNFGRLPDKTLVKKDRIFSAPKNFVYQPYLQYTAILYYSATEKKCQSGKKCLSPIIFNAILKDKAAIVRDGFTPNGVGIIEPSTTYNSS